MGLEMKPQKCNFYKFYLTFRAILKCEHLYQCVINTEHDRPVSEMECEKNLQLCDNIFI